MNTMRFSGTPFLFVLSAIASCGWIHTSHAQTCTGAYSQGGEVQLAAGDWAPAVPPTTPWGTNAPPTAAGAGGVNCGYGGILSIPACANNFATIYMCTGNSYTVSLCAGTAWDSSLSLTTAAGAEVSPATFDNDGCGVTGGLSTFTFVPTISSNYRIRIRTNPCLIDSTSCGTLEIAIGPIPGPPANNDQCGAQSLAVNMACTPIEATTQWATQSTGVSIPNGCPSSGAFAGADVWFTAVVPESGDMAVETGLMSAANIAMAAYSGTECSGLEQIACNADVEAPMALNPYLLLTDLTPGDTIWIRVWPEGGAQNGGTFMICAYEVIGMSIRVGTGTGTPIIIAPNPVGEELVVFLPTNAGESLEWSIIDLGGRILRTGEWNTATVQKSQSMNVLSLPAGSYILQFLTKEGKIWGTARFVKL